MTAAEVQRLRAEVKSDHAAFLARLDELAGLDDIHGTATMAQVAVALHHGYGAVEAALARVARQLEGSVPQGFDGHQHLLHAMSLEIPSVRPAVLSPASLAALRKLLGFRHFFRHAYAIALDPDQLAALRATALALREPLQRDLDALDAFLKELAANL
jgi:hypothetical protein